MKQTIQQRWFSKNTQQSVMSKVAQIPVFAKTGQKSKAGIGKESGKVNNDFVVGESDVGGEDVVQ